MGKREEWSSVDWVIIEALAICEKKSRITASQVRFFFRAFLDAGISLHPDTDAQEYVNHTTGRKTFTVDEAKLVNEAMAIVVTSRRIRDPYALAVEVSR